MSPVLISALTAVQTLGFALLLWKLYRADLASSYRAFTAFAVFELGRLVVAVLIPRHSNVYAWYYLLTQPALWLMYALVTLEVFHSVFRSLPGIARFSRNVIVSATGVAITISILSLTLQAETGSRFPILELYLTLERSIFLSLLAFVLMLIGFLAWYPVAVHTNAVVYSGVFALCFGVKTAALLVRTLGGTAWTIAASTAVVVSSVVSCLLWSIFLSPAGETRRTRSGRGMSDERAEELMAQLKSIDSALRSVPDRP